MGGLPCFCAYDTFLLPQEWGTHPFVFWVTLSLFGFYSFCVNRVFPTRHAPVSTDAITVFGYPQIPRIHSREGQGKAGDRQACEWIGPGRDMKPGSGTWAGSWLLCLARSASIWAAWLFTTNISSITDRFPFPLGLCCSQLQPWAGYGAGQSACLLRVRIVPSLCLQLQVSNTIGVCKAQDSHL